MSKFFKALEQAEQDRALRQPAPPAGPSESPAPADIETRPEVEGPRPAEVRLEAPDGVEEHLVSLLAPTSFEAEQYRALRHLIEQLRRSADLSAVAVSSPTGDDGKTTTAINLAGALAQSPDARVLLVDADLRGASLARQLSLQGPSTRGFVDAILDASLTLDAVVQRRPPFNLSVLPAGQRTSAPYEVLQSPRAEALLAEARRQYDYIVLDTPPLVSVPDCRVIGKWVDGFLIVVAAHRTPRKMLQEALTVMDPAKVVGLIFNSDDRSMSRYSYTYGRSSNGHGTGRGRWTGGKRVRALQARLAGQRTIASSDT